MSRARENKPRQEHPCLSSFPGDRSSGTTEQIHRARVRAGGKSCGRLTFANTLGSTSTTHVSSSTSAAVRARSLARRRRSRTDNALRRYAPGNGPACGTAASPVHADTSVCSASSVTNGRSTGSATITSKWAARRPATTPASGARTGLSSSRTGKRSGSPSTSLPQANLSSHQASRSHAISANVFSPNRARAFGDPNLRLAPPTSNTPVTPSTQTPGDMVACSPTAASPNLSPATRPAIATRGAVLRPSRRLRRSTPGLSQRVMRLLEPRALLFTTSRSTSPQRGQYWSLLASQPTRAACGQTRLFSRISPASPSAREQKSTISPRHSATCSEALERSRRCSSRSPAAKEQPRRDAESRMSEFAEAAARRGGLRARPDQAGLRRCFHLHELETSLGDAERTESVVELTFWLRLPTVVGLTWNSIQYST